MKIASASISIYERGTDQAYGVKVLMEALQDFAKSRATRKLYRFREESKVGCVLRVPLIKEECPVEAGALGRALRKVARDAIAKAAAGDQLVIDFRIGPGSLLHIEARSAEKAGLVSSMFKHFHQA
ncbi:hypothetical protein [Agrobacterium sp. LMR679]|uniref:hypothetical protein n=1 Tax=Agrobacterium sp. LMR679 TaxID=3014335 RepID=UPI0022AEC13F|nr:hypothetical protein [Agrobacterium sp. LMR679]MCZ4072151.1 hypothetical protein [Agrobacterium sp. LMR679]